MPAAHPPSAPLDPSAAAPAPESADATAPEPGDATARLAARVARRAAAAYPGRPLDALLADDLPGNDLTTLLLHSLRRRALRRTFSDVLQNAARLPMTHASSADARRLHLVDGIAYAAAAAFEAVELAPVEPLGSASCTGVDPNNVLAAARFAEVAADPATGLAMHAARRRSDTGSRAPIRLCASQRVLRLQPWDQPGFSPHFRLFALATAERSARAGDDDACERRALLGHLRVWAELFRRLAEAGFAVAGCRVVLSDTRLVGACLRARGIGDPHAFSRRAAANHPAAAEALLREAGLDLPRAAADVAGVAAALGLPSREQARARAMADEIAAPLRAEHPSVPVAFDLGRLQGLSYYAGPLVQIVARRSDGFELPIGDGGAVTWMQDLRSDRRERLVTTGVGSEIFVKLFDRTEVSR